MPKVGKENYEFGHWTGVINLTFEVHFQKGDKSNRNFKEASFFVKVPPDILKYKEHPKELHAPTYEKAVSKAKEYFDDFYKMNTSTLNLQAQSPSGSQGEESEAVAFAEWLNKTQWLPQPYGKARVWYKKIGTPDYECKSTTDLYQLFTIKKKQQ
jgi:hypothetical protein